MKDQSTLRQQTDAGANPSPIETLDPTPDLLNFAALCSVERVHNCWAIPSNCINWFLWGETLCWADCVKFMWRSGRYSTKHRTLSTASASFHAGSLPWLVEMPWVPDRDIHDDGVGACHQVDQNAKTCNLVCSKKSVGHIGKDRVWQRSDEKRSSSKPSHIDPRALPPTASRGSQNAMVKSLEATNKTRCQPDRRLGTHTVDASKPRLAKCLKHSVPGKSTLTTAEFNASTASPGSCRRPFFSGFLWISTSRDRCVVLPWTLSSDLLVRNLRAWFLSPRQ